MYKLKDKIQFSFDTREFELAEVIENPNISMWWTWSHEVCPHCKEVIEKRKQHVFNRIEIFTLANADYKYCNVKDTIFIGYDVAGYTLHLPKDKIIETLKKSTIFNYLLKETETNGA